MTPFSYHNPTRIEFGPKKEEHIGKWLREDKVERVLLVYGTGSIKKSGLYERVIESLKNGHIDYTELSGVVSNPVLSKVYEGIDKLGRSMHKRFLLSEADRLSIRVSDCSGCTL